MTQYAKPLPKIDDSNRGHWDGACHSELRVQRCLDCRTLRYPPSRHCAHCLSEQTEWAALSGRGEVWSHCTFHRAYFKGFEAEVPYTVVLVRLDEGPMLYSNLIDVAREQVRIGMRVRAVFERATDEVSLVKFRPDE